MSRKLSAQILITTLMLLMLISITVIVISVTVARNNKEVFNNLEYERSYNSAEGKLISVAEQLADPKLDLTLITTTGSANPLSDLGGSCSQLNNSKYYCAFEEVERRTIVTIEESNEVIGYEISSDEYFDVILFKNKIDSGYKGKLGIEWIGESGLELELISETSNGQVESIEEVVDNTGKIYASTGSHSYGILKNKRITALIGVNNIEVDLNNAKVAANAKLRYLRVRSVNNQTGTALTIKPIQDISLPKQVRRIEAFSYQNEGIESSAPVVITQLPLSPAVAPPLTKVASYSTIRQPVCGNGVVEGAESCDDGNLNDTDSCPNDCRECSINFMAYYDKNDTMSPANTTSMQYWTNQYLNSLTKSFAEDISTGNTNMVFGDENDWGTINNNRDPLIWLIGRAHNTTFAAKSRDFFKQKRNILFIIDSDLNHTLFNQIFQPYGLSCSGTYGYIQMMAVFQTAQTETNAKGLASIWNNTECRFTLPPGNLHPDIKNMFCQYRFIDGVCVWMTIYFNNGARVDVMNNYMTFTRYNWFYEPQFPYQSPAVPAFRKLMTDRLCQQPI